MMASLDRKPAPAATSCNSYSAQLRDKRYAQEFYISVVSAILMMGRTGGGGGGGYVLFYFL